MISAGFDAEVIRVACTRIAAGNINRARYFLPTLRDDTQLLLTRKCSYIAGEAGTVERNAMCRWLFGFNLPLYALGLPIAPDAVATDGQLDVCTFRARAAFGACCDTCGT